MNKNTKKKSNKEHSQSARELVYRSEEAADTADVMRAALMIEGKALMPAVFIAMTNGDFAAFDVVSIKSG